MKTKKLKLIASTLLIAMVGGVITGCGGNESDKKTSISISGSTSVGPLMEKIAEAYEETNPNISIEIQQIGSSAGIKDTINGTNEIGMASRELKEDEKSKVTGTVIALDGIALISNKDNPVKDLTLKQVLDIYTGKITNWNELGGKNSEIVVVSREDGSGTRAAFEELVNYKTEQLVKTAQISDGNGNVKSIVEGNKNAIGFVSFEYLDDNVTVLKLNGVEPNAESVLNKSYVLARPFNITTKKETLTENGQALIDFILSEEGQKIVEEQGLITLK